MKTLPIIQALKHIVFPHLCEGCADSRLPSNQLLCAACLVQLPETKFAADTQNAMATQFFGRIHLEHAIAAYYFTKNSLLQHLMMQLKYRNQPQVGFYLGQQLGYQLKQYEQLNDIDILVPLPLNEKKKAKRGYNQAEEIVKGMISIWPKEMDTVSVVRNVFTESQTTHSRVERLQNMQGVFAIAYPEKLANKHIALVDDVVTTGATIEACGEKILAIEGTKLSVLSVAFTL
ncbi:MAG: ComF family protein [Chitinophagaceae bacterium]